MSTLKGARATQKVSQLRCQRHSQISEIGPLHNLYPRAAETLVSEFQKSWWFIVISFSLTSERNKRFKCRFLPPIKKESKFVNLKLVQPPTSVALARSTVIPQLTTRSLRIYPSIRQCHPCTALSQSGGATSTSSARTSSQRRSHVD